MAAKKVYEIEVDGHTIRKESRAKKVYTHMVVALSRTNYDWERIVRGVYSNIAVRRDYWIPSARKCALANKDDEARVALLEQKIAKHEAEIAEYEAELESYANGNFPEMDPCYLSWHTRLDLAQKANDNDWSERFVTKIVEITPK